jgi:acyl carrier protein
MDDILAKVREVFHEAFGVEARMITIETTPNEVPGWDSVGHLDLASRLEGAFGVTFEVDDLMEMESVRDIVRLVNAKL